MGARFKAGVGMGAAVNLLPKIHENKDPTTKIEVAKLLIKTN